MNNRKLTVYNGCGAFENRRHKFYYKGTGWNRRASPPGIKSL